MTAGVILPFGGSGAWGDRSSEELLAAGRAFALDWRPAAAASSTDRWGPPISASSRLAQGITEAMKLAGEAVGDSSSLLVRLSVPPGTAISDLMPAIGGGYRGMLKDPRSGQISKHVRIDPPADASVVRSLVTSVGPMAVTAALQIVSDAALRAQLDRIEQQLAALSEHALNEMQGSLNAAIDAIKLGVAAAADGATSTEAAGLPTAVHRLKETKETALQWLPNWEGAVGKVGSRNRDNLRRDLGKGPGGLGQWERRVLLLHQALALDARMTVLSDHLMKLANPDVSLLNFSEAALQRLEENATSQERLRRAVRGLSALRLTVDRFERFAPWGSTQKEGSELSSRMTRMSHALRESESVAITAGGPSLLQIEARRGSEGSLQLLVPQTAAA